LIFLLLIQLLLIGEIKTATTIHLFQAENAKHIKNMI
jgi:hypothetical protein